MLVVRSSHPDTWFRDNHTNGGPASRYFFHNAAKEVSWPTVFSNDRWIILLDADTADPDPEAVGQLGGKFACLTHRFTRAYAGQNTEPGCVATGVLAHEL